MDKLLRRWLGRKDKTPGAFQVLYCTWHMEIVDMASEAVIDSFAKEDDITDCTAPDFPPEYVIEHVYLYGAYAERMIRRKIF